jgi:hypothetical protein
LRTIKAGTVKRIHVNGHVIRSNKKQGRDDPVFTVKTSKENTYGKTVCILGPAMLVQDFDKRLASGAVAWIETRAEVEIYP